MIQLRGPSSLPISERVAPPSDGVLSWIDIDLARLERNLHAIRQLIAPDFHQRSLDQPLRPTDSAGSRRSAGICGVVKKNAYGLGADQVGPRLAKAGCAMLGVFCAEEAELLVRRAVDVPILIMMPFRHFQRTDALYRHASAGKLHLTIHDPGQIDALNQLGRKLGLRLPLHLYVDTGMSRGGLNAAQFQRVVERQGDFPHTVIVGVYSHFATADSDPDFAREQLERFERLVLDAGDALPRNVMLHAANTAATLRDVRFHMDMVRPGLGLCGYGAETLAPGSVISDCPQLEPVARWMSRIIHVQRYPRRTPVGYGSTFKLQRASVLGLVPVGYADGYPVSLSSKAQVRVIHPDAPHTAPQPVRVRGKVNMDQIVIDLTDIIGDDGEPLRFMQAEVEVYSDDPAAPNALPNLAGIAKTNVYELLCRLSPSVPRRYAYR